MTWAQERRKSARRAAAFRKERAQQRVEIDGRLVAPLPPEMHGRLSTYSNWMCRCVPCCEITSEYMAEYSRKRKAQRRARDRDR